MSQFEYISDDGVVQNVPYTSQLLVPTVPLVAVEVMFTPPDTFVVKKYPVVAIRQTIQERWGKKGSVDDSERLYSTAGEFEEAGYEFFGRSADIEFLFVANGYLESVNGMLTTHRHEEGEHEKPVVEAGCLRVCYKDDMKDTIATLKVECQEYFEELQEAGCGGDDMDDDEGGDD